jgi:Repeat of unknown function (DUF5907)
MVSTIITYVDSLIVTIPTGTTNNVYIFPKNTVTVNFYFDSSTGNKRLKAFTENVNFLDISLIDILGTPTLSEIGASVDGLTDIDDINDALQNWKTAVYLPSSYGSVSLGNKGDITVSGTGDTWNINNGVIGTIKLGGDITAAGKALLDDANAAAQRTTLGLGNVDNTSDATKNSATATLTSKTISGSSNTITNVAQSSITNLVTDLAAKQATLVSGTNIKTINSTSLLGSGNIVITGGGANLSYTASPTNGVVASDSGTDATLTLVDGTNAGLASPSMKSTWDSKEGAITATTSADYYRGDKTFQTLNKTAVGLSNVDNTSDSTKNSATVTLTNKTISGASNTISNIAQSSVTNLVSNLSGKEPTISAGTTGQYWRGDKTWQTLTIPSVGTWGALNYPTWGSGTPFVKMTAAGTFALDTNSYTIDNNSVTGATKTKITYDSKGRITSGADATTVDIADSTNKRYVTDANLTTIGNQSGTNTGDNAVNSLYSGLVSNATHTGDVTGSGALTIANDAVTFAKMQNITTARLLGRNTAGTGDVEEITLGTNLSFSGTTLNASGGGGSTNLSLGTWFEDGPVIILNDNGSGVNIDIANTGQAGIMSGGMVDTLTLVSAQASAIPTGGTTGQVLSKIDGTDYNTQWVTPTVGTVTSVGLSVPTGLSISGSPVTSSGTLAITLTAGYSIPTTTSQTNWDTAYTNRITSLTTTGTSGTATLIGNTLNIPQYAGTSYTFSTGLTNTSGTVTANLSVGVSGGQSVIGGTASGNNLTLSSTSHATKGNIVIGASYYDEVNNRLGINMVPTYDLDIASASGGLRIRGTSAAVFLGQRSSDNTGSANGYFYKSRGTVASPTTTISGDAVGVFVFGAHDGTNFLETANFGSIVDGAVSTGVAPMAIRFNTGTTTANRAEVMRVGSNGCVGIGTTSPTSKLHVVGGTLTDLVPGMYYSATMPTTITNTNTAFDVQVTSAGSSAFTQRAVNITQLSGFTGAGSSIGLVVENFAAGTGTGVATGTLNQGVGGACQGTTVGTNIGFGGVADNGNVNIGVRGRAWTAKNSATNIGVLGIGLNTGTTPIQVGGYFGLNSSNPTFASAALMADNGTTTDPIFVARDNGTTVMNIADGGAVNINLGSPATATNFLTVNGTKLETTGVGSAIIATNTISPTGAFSAGYRTLNFSNTFNTSYASSATEFSCPVGGYFENRIVNSGAIANVEGVRAYGIVMGGSAVSAGTITRATGLAVQGLTSFSNSVVNTFTNVSGMYIINPIKNTSTITNNAGIILDNMSGGTNNTNLVLGSYLSQPTGNYSIYNQSTYNNYFAGNLGIGNTNPTSKLDIIAGTLTDTVAGFKFTATLPTTITAANYGADYQITTAGSSSQDQYGLNIDLLAGYTGSSNSVALRFNNTTAGTGTAYFSNKRNIGAGGFCSGTTTGANVGVFGSGSNGNISIGVAGRAFTDKNSGKNIGVFGVANNGGTSPVVLGGYFGIHPTEPTLASAALMCDNGSTTSDIFVCRDNGTAVFTIGDGGTVGMYGVTAVARATTSGSASTFVANTSLITNDTATWDGYTIGQVVKALRNLGILT